MVPERKSDQKTYGIIGAAMTVHKELGHGFLEPVYQAAMERELKFTKIPSRREIALPVVYKGKLLPVSYRADFICYDSIILELKALSQLSPVEDSQIINYLKATHYTLGLLLNFGAPNLQFKRFIHSK